MYWHLPCTLPLPIAFENGVIHTHTDRQTDGQTDYRNPPANVWRGLTIPLYRAVSSSLGGLARGQNTWCAKCTVIFLAIADHIIDIIYASCYTYITDLIRHMPRLWPRHNGGKPIW